MTIDWQTVGGANTNVGTNPFSITSDTGRAFTISKPSAGAFNRRNQVPPAGGGWAGNFAGGDALLTHLNSDGPVVIRVTSAQGVVSAAGVQIMPNQNGAFVATIEAFDVNGASLGSFSVNGTSNGNSDNSAIFVGVLSDTENIHSVSVDTNTTDNGGDFAINRVSLRATVTQDPPPTGTATTWLGGNGLWNDGSKWSNGVPNSPSHDVIVDNAPGTNSIITIAAGVQGSVGRLRIDVGDRVQTQDNSNLYITATAFAGAGELLLNGTLAIPGQELVGDKVINGTGKLVLGGVVGQNARVTGATTNNGTIEGSGQFGFHNSDRYRIDNNGTINANVPGQSLLLYGLGGAGRSTNSGIMKATSGGFLLLGQGQWFGAPTSSIIADGPGSELLFRDGVLVEGGSMSAINGGLIRPGGAQPGDTHTAAWKDLTVSGPTEIRSGTLYLDGTVTNNGVITVPDLGGRLDVSSNTGQTVTLAGTAGQPPGQVVLDKAGSDQNLAFLNQTGKLVIENQLVRGRGFIGYESPPYPSALELTNRGTFQADRNNELLRLHVGLLDNQSGGTLRAQDGGVLRLHISGTLRNTGGTIEALRGGRVEAQFARIEGGLIRNGKPFATPAVPGGFIPLNGMTLVNPGTGMRLEGDLTLGIAGANQGATIVNEIENKGILRIAASTHLAHLRIGESPSRTASLTGGGQVVLGDVASGSMESGLFEAFGNSFVHTLNNVDNTIHGFGRIGDPYYDRWLSVNNTGLISADVPNKTLHVELHSADNTGGTFRATNGGRLMIWSRGGFDNVGGTIETAQPNSSLAFGWFTDISGGLLRSAGGTLGTFDLSHAIIRNPGSGVTLQGPFVINNNREARFVGEITNEGSVTAMHEFNDTRLIIGEAGKPNVIMKGGGEIVVKGSVAGQEYGRILEGVNGATLTLENQTLRGSGLVGYTHGSRQLRIANNNSIGADENGKILQLSIVHLQNNAGAIARAINGGNLVFDSFTIANAGANILAGSGSTVTFGADGNFRRISGGVVHAGSGGTLNLQEGIRAEGGIVFNNAGLAIFGSPYGNRSFNAAENGGGTFLNSGTIRKIENSTFWLDAPFTDTGAVNTEAGVLFLLKGATITNGTFNTGPGAEVRFGGTQPYAFAGGSNTFLGTGRAVVDNTTLTLADAATQLVATKFRFEGNTTLTGPGALDVSGQLNFAGYGITTTISGARVRLREGGVGALEDHYGAMLLNNGATFENSGVLTLAGYTTTITGAAPALFKTTATGVTKFTDAATLAVPVEISNTGGWTLSAGLPRGVALQKGGSFTNAKFNITLPTSEWFFTGAAPFKFYGRANESVGGVMKFDSATVQFQDTTPSDPADDPLLYTSSQIQFAGSETNFISGRGEFSTTGGFVFSSGNVLVHDTVLRNDAAGTASSLFASANHELSFTGAARFINNSRFVIQAAGSTFTGTANTLFHNAPGGRVVQNTNTTTNFNIPFLNEGFLEFRAGNIYFDQRFSGNGGIAVSGGSKVDLGATAFTDPNNLPSGLQASGAGSELRMTLANGQVHTMNTPNAIKAENGGKVDHRGGSALTLSGPTATALIQNPGSQLARSGGDIITHDGASIITHDGARLVGHDGSSLIGQDGGSLIGQDGGSLIGQDGGSLIGQDGGSMVAAGAGNIVAAGAGNIVAAGGLNRAFSFDALGRTKARQPRSSLDELTGKPGLDALMAKVDSLSTNPRAGKIFVDTGGNASVAGGTIIAENGGILAGGGTFTGPGLVKSGGALLPGSTVGTMTWNGNLTIQSGGLLQAEIGGSAAGTHDRVNITGTFTMAGTIGVRFVNSFGNVQPTAVFDIVTASSPIATALAGTRVAVIGTNGSFAIELVNGGKTLRLTDYQTSSVPLTFSNWASSYGLTGANAAWNADPNNNGLGNLLEYALGLDPTASGGSVGTSTGTIEENGQKYLTLSYTRPTGNNARADITYTPERASSLALKNWSSAAADVVPYAITPGPGSLETVTVRSTHPVSSTTREFLRLKVSLTP